MQHVLAVLQMETVFMFVSLILKIQFLKMHENNGKKRTCTNAKNMLKKTKEKERFCMALFPSSWYYELYYIHCYQMQP